MKIESGEGGLARITVDSPLAEAQVYLHGAHVTHFQPRGAEPVLFMSGKSQFAPGKPIRGGIPVIFPWFGPKAGDSAAPAHGFARTAEWTLLDADASAEKVTLRLGLASSDASKKWVPNEFELVYTVGIGRALELSLEVRNLSFADFNFEEALHTYLKVGDVRQASIEGLSGKTYIDKTAAMARKTQTGPIRITGETDRVYLDTLDTVTVTDPVLGRRLEVSKTGSRATVVWNPWIEKARSMPDFGDDEWPHMLCVETANAADHAVTLAAGQSHRMWAMIRAEPSQP
jgi:glucose-6-phosphate 1-epimerase